MRPERYDQRRWRDHDDQERAAEAQADGATTRGLVASKRYRVDPSYSRAPWCICGNTTIGLPPCDKGEGKYCYCRIPCSSQMEEDGETRLKAAQKLYEEESSAAIKHAHELADKDSFFNDAPDESIEDILRFYGVFGDR